MRAAVVHEPGGPEVLVLEEAAVPQPGPGQVLVRVAIAGVNPIDWKFRNGSYPKDLPTILGIDFAGVVEQSQADGFAPGDPVFGRATSGSYAELAVADVAGIAHKPAQLSDEQAASLPVVALTAYQSLFEVGGLQSGQRALISAASGGVGHIAVQLAKRAGAHVTATGSAANRDFVLSLGADEYIDYNAQDVASAVTDIDVALDYVGGANTAALVPTIRPGGILVTIANQPPQVEGIRTEFFSSHPDGPKLAELGQLAADGELRVEIAEVLPFEQVARAHELSEAGRTRGKLLLRL